MIDLIDRQAAVDAIRAKDDYSNAAVAIGLGKAMTAVCELPSVQQRMMGKWIDQKGGGCCCSECGGYALDEPDGNFIHVAVKSNFCPNCGADMRI